MRSYYLIMVLIGLSCSSFLLQAASKQNRPIKNKTYKKLNVSEHRKLVKEVHEALKDPQLRELMLSQGNEIGGGTPADFAALIRSESIKWGAVVRIAKIKPE